MDVQILTERFDRLQKAIGSQKLDAFVTASEDNIWYLTGITYKPEERPFFIIVAPDKKPILIVPKLEEKHLSKIRVECDIKVYWDYPSPAGENWYDVLENELKGYSRVGVEKSLKAEILETLHTAEIVQADLISDMRKQKNPYEIGMIIEAAKISDDAMALVLKNAYVGASVLQMFSLSRSVQTQLIRSKNYDPILTSLLTAVWPAPDSAMPHSIPSLSGKLGRGSNVAMSYFRINGYAAECERTFFLGECASEDRAHFQHMINARNHALSVLKAGVRCSDVDAAAKEYLILNGYQNYLLHRTGHGIGLGNHEAPFIAQGSEEVLKENMVISIEPGIYIEGIGGYRHSDTIRVTKEGYELLTRFPTDFEAMTITGFKPAARLKGWAVKKALKL